jgi:predicted RNase H-like HicB family nuclease
MQVKTIEELMVLPWGWVGPFRVQEDGDTFWEARIRELPDFFVAGTSAPEVEEQCEDALRAFLMSYIEAGEEPPLPIWSYGVIRPVPVSAPIAPPMLARKVAAG